MRRRTFLVSTASVSVAGCTSGTSEGADTETVVGEEIAYEGLETTVGQYETGDVLEGSEIETTHRSGDATTILIAHVSVENTGDVRRLPPQPHTGSMYLNYQGEERPPLLLSSEFALSGQTYEIYRWTGGQKEDRYIYPGATMGGWAGFEVESAFQESETAVVCGLGSDDIYQEFSWYLGE